MSRILAELRENDVWIGKNIFHSPIIFLCHLLKCTQHRLQRDLWFLGFLSLVCFQLFISKEPVNWFDWIILSILFISASLTNQKTKGTSFLVVRIFLLACVFSRIMEIIFAVVNDSLNYEDFVELMVNIMFVTAEYAATIDTIPPRGSSKRKEVYHESFS